MSQITLSTTEVGALAKICELATRLNTSIISHDKASLPGSTIVRLKYSYCSADITVEQLKTASRILNLICKVNHEFLKITLCNSSEQRSTTKDDMPRPVKESYTFNDLTDAMILGVKAKKAHIEVAATYKDEGSFMLRAESGNPCELVSLNDLHLAREIFEVVCEANSFTNTATNSTEA